MATSAQSLGLALRGSEGVRIVTGVPSPSTESRFPRVESRNCKVMTYSKDGSLFGFCDGMRVSVFTTCDYRLTLQIDRPRTVEIGFSPKNNFVVTWEPYFVTKDNPQGNPNLNIWEVRTGRHVRGLFQKKHSGWSPQWSDDEEICGRNVNNEVQFYEKNSFDSPVHKLHLQKVLDYKLANASTPPYHIAAYVPGSKGQPSYVRIYRYPNFGGPNAALANKSFYNADRVDLLWNNKGSHLLLLTATDTSAESYYGDQGLHFMATDGESCLVPRAKNGPVYSVEWNPKSTDFCVVYGFMPAKATLYNLKCEPVFDFGTGPRNITYYNPHGNILCLAGFGNLGGSMEFWDVRSKKLISKTEARDSTYFEWCPDGKHIVTATTSPRLRVGNGYKLWEFSGVLLHEDDIKAGEELWDISWQTAATGTFPEPRLPFGPLQTASKQEEKPAAYVPPALRNKLSTERKPKYRDEYEPPSNPNQQTKAPENLSKAALKNRKKREAKARAKEQQTAEQTEVPAASPAAFVPPSQPAALSTGDPETDKRIKNLNKKLRQIQQLKEQQASGKQLELNQLEKLKTEASLVKELEELQLG